MALGTWIGGFTVVGELVHGAVPIGVLGLAYPKFFVVLLSGDFNFGKTPVACLDRPFSFGKSPS